jgi:hypothetical protein
MDYVNIINAVEGLVSNAIWYYQLPVIIHHAGMFFVGFVAIVELFSLANMAIKK